MQNEVWRRCNEKQKPVEIAPLHESEYTYYRGWRRLQLQQTPENIKQKQQQNKHKTKTKTKNKNKTKQKQNKTETKT